MTLSAQIPTVILASRVASGDKRKICIPIDGSAISKQTIEWAIKEIIQKDDFVTLVHVAPSQESVELLFWGGSNSSPYNEQEMKEKLNAYQLKSANVLFAEMRALIAEDIDVECIMLKGDARHQLLTYIENNNPLMVTMGRHGSGKGFFSGIELGSVSTFLVKHSPSPVVIVPLKK